MEKSRSRSASVFRRRNQSMSMSAVHNNGRDRKMSQLMLPVDGALSAAEKGQISSCHPVIHFFNFFRILNYWVVVIAVVAEIRRNRRAVLKYDDEDDDEDAEGEEEGGGARRDADGTAGAKYVLFLSKCHCLLIFRQIDCGTRSANSILPVDKSFSAGLFLSIIHNNISFDELRGSLQHLSQLIDKQTNQRENLVREHFGLFISCADDLEWLKAYRMGSK